MLLVPCPNCGPRNSADLRYGGESHARPDPATASPLQWRGYLYLRDNPAGWLRQTRRQGMIGAPASPEASA